MQISRNAIHRPVTTTMFFLIIILFGVVSFFRLPIDLMPDVTFPAVTVSTDYPNVGPQEIEQLITRPVEEAMSSIQGVEKMTSESVEGEGDVRVAFKWGTDISEAANDVRSRVDRARSQLPEDIEPPVIYKFDLSQFSVVYLGVTGRMDPVDLLDLVERQVKYRIERQPGVAAVRIRGGQKREIHVNLDRRKLTALDLSLEQILQSLRNENLNLPAGKVDEGDLEILVRTKGQFETVDQVANTVVQTRDGVPILVKDLGTVEDSMEEITYISRMEGVPVLRLYINKQSGANTVEVVKGVLEEVERINEDYPQINVFVTGDTSQFIKRAINNVSNSTLFGALLASIILYIFLRNFRSTLIIAVAIPISIISTFVLMYYCELTLNLMTFGGLALGVGMLVDNAIVVLENIYRHYENGEEGKTAAINGTDEVSTAIFASTMTTIVVFLPIFFIRDLSGVIYRQLAIVVVFALFCSLVAALTLIPVMASRLYSLKKANPTKSKTSKFFDFIEREYSIMLTSALKFRKTILLCALVFFGCSIWMTKLIGVEFMPQADEGEIRVNVEMAVGTRIEVVDEVMQEIEKITRDTVPEAEIVYYRAGGGGFGNSGSHTGEVRATLVPSSQRERSAADVAKQLRSDLAHIPGVVLRVRESQGLFIFRILAGESESAEVQIRGYDLDIARDLAHQVKEEMEKVDGISDVRISREEGQPEEIVRIDRAKAASLGLSVAQIARAIETSLTGTSASMYRDAGDEYKILVRLTEADRLSVRDVLDMTVTSDSGRSVVLKNVVTLTRREGPVRIEREDQQRVIDVSGNIAGRDFGSVMADVKTMVDGIAKPNEFEIVLSGQYEEQQKAFFELMMGFCLAIILVYMVMASQFESLRDPFIVMFSIPLAIIGVVVTLLLTDTTFNVQSFMGCIMLTGIVVNNAIILVDYTNLLRKRDGLPMMEAIVNGAKRRLRPIMMTTLTTAVGLLPLAIGLGDGGEVQAPMARVVIGGLLSSGFITLFIIPILYSYFERKSVEPS